MEISAKKDFFEVEQKLQMEVVRVEELKRQIEQLNLTKESMEKENQVL